MWLKENKVIGISNIDTRYLTKIIREQGVCRARIYPTNFDKLIPFININDENLVSKVSLCNELIEYKSNNTLNNLNKLVQVQEKNILNQQSFLIVVLKIIN